MMDYQDFIDSKRLYVPQSGFECPDSALNPRMFDWQRLIVQWALRRGCAALFEDCGLGKTIQQLEWAAAVARETDSSVLLLCPVAIAEQTREEARKFDVQADVNVVSDWRQCRLGICITNYEKLHRFEGHLDRFGGVVLDESSILKGFTGKIRNMLCELFASTPYKLACTATPAPNDHMELGNHAEFLGIMQHDVMLAKFFTHDGGDTSKWRLKGHSRGDFWDWVSQWAVSISKPSDIGFSDEGYELPELRIHTHVTESAPPPGMLFHTGAKVSATNVHTEKRAALAAKADLVAGLVNGDHDQWVVWCDSNYEADALTARIPDAVEVRGSESEKQKSSKLLGFTRGECRVMITKPEIGGLGLNWQHCCKTAYFVNFSYERWYQSVRRFYRFGQRRPVDCHLIMSENEATVASALEAKAAAHGEMVSEMTAAMKAGMERELHGRKPLAKYEPTVTMQMPQWIGA